MSYITFDRGLGDYSAADFAAFASKAAPGSAAQQLFAGCAQNPNRACQDNAAAEFGAGLVTGADVAAFNSAVAAGGGAPGPVPVYHDAAAFAPLSSGAAASSPAPVFGRGGRPASGNVPAVITRATPGRSVPQVTGPNVSLLPQVGGTVAASSSGLPSWVWIVGLGAVALMFMGGK